LWQTSEAAMTAYGAPADPPEQRHPEPMAPCDCPRPLVLGRAYDDTPPRCFLCTKPIEALLNAEGGAGLVDVPVNGAGPAKAHNQLLMKLLTTTKHNRLGLHYFAADHLSGRCECGSRQIPRATPVV
jgi:hypothetical protein